MFVDVVIIKNKNALHVVVEATRYQVEGFLPDMSTDVVWRALRMSWIDEYLGSPDIIAHDARKNFIANAFQLNAGIMKIETKHIPVESANTMTYIQRYHATLNKGRVIYVVSQR